MLLILNVLIQSLGPSVAAMVQPVLCNLTWTRQRSGISVWIGLKDTCWVCKVPTQALRVMNGRLGVRLVGVPLSWLIRGGSRGALGTGDAWGVMCALAWLADSGRLLMVDRNAAAAEGAAVASACCG